MHICLVFTKKDNLSIRFDNFETYIIEIENGKDTNKIANLVYTPPRGSTKTFHEY